MPAQSQQQQKLFGLALSVKRGETPRSEASEDVLGIVDSMSEKEIEDFASTAHKGLPKKVDEFIREEVRKHINENIPRMFKVYLGVQNKLRKLEDEQKKMLGQFKDEKDPKKKRNILDKMKDGTVRLKKVRANLADIEREYINKASYDTSYSENIKISKDDMDKLHSDGEVEVDGEKITYDESVNEAVSKTYKIPTQRGTLHIEVEEDPGGVFVDVIFNRVDLTTTDIQFPTGEVIVTQRQKRVKLKESVNEGIEPQIKKIAYFTGTRPEAVEDFVSKHALNITKLLKYVEKGGLPQRMELVSALAGRPNNPKQKKIIKMFNESINEASKPSIKMVNKFEPKEGIQIMAVKTLDGKTHFGGMVQRGNLARIIPFVPNQSKSDVQKRALQIFDELEKDEAIKEEFKSKDSTFEKVYGIFDKRDYFNAKGLAKVQIGNFERALQKNDKGAQQILDKFKGDMDKAKDYIIQVITDRKKEDAFNQYKAFKAAVDSIQKGKPQYGAVDLVKSRIHNNSQKYTIALYSALRNQKFTKWKDIHNDIDSLIK